MGHTFSLHSMIFAWVIGRHCRLLINNPPFRIIKPLLLIRSRHILPMRAPLKIPQDDAASSWSGQTTFGGTPSIYGHPLWHQREPFVSHEHTVCCVSCVFVSQQVTCQYVPCMYVMYTPFTSFCKGGTLQFFTVLCLPAVLCLPSWSMGSFNAVINDSGGR